MGISDELNRLHELHQAGALTDAEFEQAKARAIAGSVSLKQVGHSADLGESVNLLRRSHADRWLGGVCGGLGRVSGIESWVWRLLFVMFTLTFGFGVLLYLLMWIFVPEE